MKDLILKHTLQNAINYKGKASPQAVLGHILQEDPSLKNSIPELTKEIQKTVQEINKLTLEQQTEKLKSLAPLLLQHKKTSKKKSLPKLKSTRNLVMRFEPSPSGPLHIGHAYVLALNSAYCKKYNGKLILRIGDTNPENIYTPAYKLIKEDAKWLTKISRIYNQSDRLPIYYRYAIRLLKKGKAYICTCDSEKFRKLLLNKEPCPCRNLDSKEQLKRWKKMLRGYKQGEAVLRIKTSLQDSNPALRDWPAFRINETKHSRQGKLYRVWPLMNFAVSIDDHEMKITTIIRAKDHIDNEKRQFYIYKYFNWKTPQTFYVGRINFKDLKLSTTETRALIKKGKYTGWDDPRLPFLLSLRRRGYQPGSLIKYALDVGITETDKLTTIEEFFKTINAFNKDIIDEKANRYFFIKEPKKIKISNTPSLKAKLPLHPNFKNRGSRTLKARDEFYIQDTLKPGKLYRLIGLFNFKDSTFISKRYSKEDNAKLIHWLPISSKLVNTEIIMPDNSKIRGLAEPLTRKLKLGSIIQFQRFGFVRLDKKTKSKLTFYFTHK